MTTLRSLIKESKSYTTISDDKFQSLNRRCEFTWMDNDTKIQVYNNNEKRILGYIIIENNDFDIIGTKNKKDRAIIRSEWDWDMFHSLKN